jgi:orotidine-5'-phosphate decarboxylase
MNPAKLEAERKLIVALDFPGAGEAYAFWQRLALPNAVAKIGLDLLFAGGAALAQKLASEGARVFVDAKLLDTGNTVERATARFAALGAAFLTVHAQNRETVEAAVRGRSETNLELVAVTHLMSAEPETPDAQGMSLSAHELMLRRASFAAEAGFDGVASSPLEARLLKASFGERLAVVCPGIRLRGAQAAGWDDPVRAATPNEALREGADYIVVGRPITRARDPAGTARAIIAEMADALVTARNAM